MANRLYYAFSTVVCGIMLVKYSSVNKKSSPEPRTPPATVSWQLIDLPGLHTYRTLASPQVDMLLHVLPTTKPKQNPAPAPAPVVKEDSKPKQEKTAEGRCPIPAAIWRAIDDLPNKTANDKAQIAAAAFIETTWRCQYHCFDSHGIPAARLAARGVRGHSWGLFQIHDYWRNESYEKMGAKWSDPKVNLAAYLDTLAAHRGYWPHAESDWRKAHAHYNGGSRGNYSYAEKCLRKADELVVWFADASA